MVPKSLPISYLLQWFRREIDRFWSCDANDLLLKIMPDPDREMRKSQRRLLLSEICFIDVHEEMWSF